MTWPEVVNNAILVLAGVVGVWLYFRLIAKLGE